MQLQRVGVSKTPALLGEVYTAWRISERCKLILEDQWHLFSPKAAHTLPSVASQSSSALFTIASALSCSSLSAVSMAAMRISQPFCKILALGEVGLGLDSAFTCGSAICLFGVLAEV